MRNTLQRNDDRLAETVLAALRSEPALAGDQIFVTVDGGAATLYGRVRSEAEADLAEDVALRTSGVAAVAQSMFVTRGGHCSDTDIARSAAISLMQSPDVPVGVSAIVHDRVLTLIGSVDSMEEQAAACRAVQFIDEAQVVVNAISLRSHRFASVEIGDQEELRK